MRSHEIARWLGPLIAFIPAIFVSLTRQTLTFDNAVLYTFVAAIFAFTGVGLLLESKTEKRGCLIALIGAGFWFINTVIGVGVGCSAR